MGFAPAGRELIFGVASDCLSASRLYRPTITEGVDFDVVAREWRMKWSPDNDKKSLQVRALYFCIKTAA